MSNETVVIFQMYRGRT